MHIQYNCKLNKCPILFLESNLKRGGGEKKATGLNTGTKLNASHHVQQQLPDTTCFVFIRSCTFKSLYRICNKFSIFHCINIPFLKRKESKSTILSTINWLFVTKVIKSHNILDNGVTIISEITMRVNFC
jgi:hypothetical protein